MSNIRAASTLLILFGTSLLYISKAQAACSHTASSSISVPNMVVQRDAPVGSQIGTEVVAGNVQFFSCDTILTTPSWSWYVKSHGSYVTTIGDRRIYSTSIPGIGYAIGMEDTNNCLTIIRYVTETNNQNMLCYTDKAGMFTTFTMKGKARLTFYKTAPITGSGVVNSANVGAAILLDNGTWRPDSALIMNSFTVTTTACSVTNTAIKVPMGDVLKTAFTGQGSTTAEKDFNINLDCDAATRVNLTLEDPTGKSPLPGVLALTPATSGSTATGVGVQVLYKNAPVTFGNMFTITTTTAKNTLTIPLKARYYQTAATVTGGQANSRATFTLTYQ
ncbi:fimbrial protein [Serratia proteamaculans]|jgi:type 1 fimbria pilin|uniref:fimbrial protein n=1 Tax=Serratia proteamaculans TaxID=28151 RepID=UPI0021770B19|nr:fimbrial protein [Serratia proteamaculans]CAI1551103.1 Type-1A pilin [Serratia proteamaculans]CAI2414117.1 Type-1A pilin [Serratia proteamaculans]